jgi:glycosyltransferase involved in cell wall biosynthesis
MQEAVAGRPLITLLLVAYNQEQYVGQAVEGAFAQTYSPLEILLSDDCSPDRTFAIMEEMAARYRGAHQIRLNRNEQNLGFGGHLDHLMNLARGELIVLAAGDDISLPERVERTWQAYVESGRRAMSLYSSLIMIDEQGARQKAVGKPPRAAAYDLEAYLAAGTVHGCSHAWHRRVFEVFGPMYPGTVYEDRVIPLRAILLGEIRYIEEPLVLYRRHSQSITGPQRCTAPDFDVAAYVIKRQKRRLLTLRNHQRDLLRQHESIRFGMGVRHRLAASVRRQIARLELEIAFNEGTFGERLRVIRRGVWAHAGLPRLAKWCLHLVYPYHFLRVRKKLVAESAGKE